MTTPHTTPELLPCPFCHSAEVAVSLPTCTKATPYNAAHRAFPVARCRSCGASKDGKDWDQTGNSAIEAWNTRAATQTAKAAPEGVSDKQIRLLCFILRRFIASGYERANEAAQDKTGTRFKPGTATAVLGDVAEAELLHTIFSTMVAAAPQPPASVQPLAVGVEATCDKCKNPAHCREYKYCGHFGRKFAAQPRYVLVPAEPTPEMIDAGCPIDEYLDHYDMKTAYTAMVAAAPRLPAGRQDGSEAADSAYEYAVGIATSLFKKHFAGDDDYASGRVTWSPCDTTVGVLTQIDNMVSGLAASPQPPGGMVPKGGGQ